MTWNQTYGGAHIDEAYSVVQTLDRGYAIVGRTRSFGAGSEDFWLVKTNSTGNMQWNKTYGGSDADTAYSVAEKWDGGYAIVGYTFSFGAGSEDFWLVQTNSSGDVQGYCAFGGASSDCALSIVPTRDGGYAVVGYTGSYGAGRFDFWLVKFGASLNLMWNKTYGGTYHDSAYSVVHTSDGGYALAGTTDSFDPGNRDMWLIKLGLSDLTDLDGDSLYDVWETDGIDYDFDGTTDLNITEANHLHKDIYLEIDYMDSFNTTPFHDHRPDDSAISSVVSAFANAPVSNPDGVDGIALHIEVNDQFRHKPVIDAWRGFDQLKEMFFGTPAQRSSVNNATILAAKRLAYRYCLFIHQYALWSGTQWVTTTSSGIAELPGNDFIVSLGSFTNPHGTSREQAGTLMHELGHTLGLRHGGGDDINGKPNYLSVMSYAFQLDRWHTGLLDYSRDELPPLNENVLNETLGIQGPSDGRTVWGDSSFSGNVSIVSTQGPVDWDLNRTIDSNPVVRSVNDFLTWGWGDGLFTIMEGYDDWANLKYNFRLTSGFSEGVHLNTETNEITAEIDWEMKNAPFIGFHDVAITKIKPSKTVVGTGYSASINITVANQGYYTETFNGTVYANTTLVTSQILTLTSGNSTTLNLTWNTTGFAKGNYTIKAYAWPVPGETDTLDNTLSDGWIIVAMVGDLTGPNGYPDRKCDMRDVYLVARGFGAEHVTDPNDPRYCEYWHKTPCGSCPHTPSADINCDGKIDMRDVYVVARNFGKTDP